MAKFFVFLTFDILSADKIATINESHKHDKISDELKIKGFNTKVTIDGMLKDLPYNSYVHDSYEELYVQTVVDRVKKFLEEICRTIVVYDNGAKVVRWFVHAGNLGPGDIVPGKVNISNCICFDAGYFDS